MHLFTEAGLALDWLQSLKQVFIYVSLSYTCSQFNSDGSFKTEPSELDWLQVYGMTYWWKIVFKDWSQSMFAPAHWSWAAPNSSAADCN